LFGQAGLKPSDGRYVTCTVTAAGMAYLLGLRRADAAEFAANIAEIHLGHCLPEDAICDPSDPQSMAVPASRHEALATEELVVIGVIDEGMAFAHERFRTRDHGSRVEYIWMQDAACLDDGSDIGHGRELSKQGWDHNGAPIAGIDQMLDEHSRGGQLNEAALYHAAGLADFARPGHKAAVLRTAHGTHVMDLAAGEDPSENRQDRPIICVQLPSATVADISGIGLEKYLIDAVAYILDRATRLVGEGKPRVVINFSSGMRAGSHDGSGPIESALDEILERYSEGEERDLAHLVLPVGNGHLARGHAKFSLKAAGEEGATRSLALRIQPDDRTSSFVEIWLSGLPDSTADGISLEITPPGGVATSGMLRDSEDPHALELVRDGDVVCKAYFERVPKPRAGRSKAPPDAGRLLIALLPTAYHEAPTRLAPAGEWVITLSNGTKVLREAQAWIHWDRSPIGYSQRGRQAYFDDLNYELFDRPSGHVQEMDNNNSLVRRQGATSAITTGQHPIVVGAYQRRDKGAAIYASRGPVPALAKGNHRHMNGVDAAAVADESKVVVGILAAGSHSGSNVALNGTSVAAPQVARALARKPGLDGKAVIAQMAKAADPPNAKNRKRPGPDRVGFGRLNLPAHLDSPAQRHRQSRTD
jgi:hypothetical protein